MFRAIVQLLGLETSGSTIYYSRSSDEGTNRSFVHRHRFRCYHYLCGCFVRSNEELEVITKAEILRIHQESTVPDATKVERIRSKLTESLKGALASVVEATKKTNSKSAVVTPESPALVDRAVEGLKVSRDPSRLIKNLEMSSYVGNNKLL
jgi:hypothetical protein